jgi:hypothetical protein
MSRTMLSFDMGIVNLSMAIVRWDDDQNEDRFRILKWLNVDIRAGTAYAASKVNSLSIETVVTLFHQVYVKNISALVHEHGPTSCEDGCAHIAQVLIERQPGPNRFFRGNPKTHVLSHCLQTHLLRDGVPATAVVMVCPKLKIKYCERLCPEEAATMKKRYKRKYTYNKNLAVHTCKQLMFLQASEMQSVFEKSKKKDDLSESFLQALAFVLHAC